jgi:phosphohistidine phosphatase SixA
MKYPGYLLRISLCGWFALFTSGVPAQQLSSEPIHGLSGPALVSALRAGGFVLYFRHTSTDFGQSDDSMTTFEDCAKQRNLTDKGRNEARAIGSAILELQIPVDRVLASPFCRTVETAMLAFGKAEKTLDLRGWPASSTDPNRYAALRGYLAAPPVAATNTVLVGHGNPFRSVAGPPHLMEGEAAVIRPLGGERFEIVARIQVQEWTDLLKVSARSR